LNICLPPIPEQRAIAHILGTLDDKIELNRRMNETLEAMARALFKSWFVDFAPVRAKAEGRWKRGQSLPGLPANFYDLFPGSFEDSELGEIPKGWRMTRLADVLKESNERVGNLDVPEYSSTNNGLQLRSERYKKTLSVSSSKNKLIRKGFLVFGLSRRVLNFGLMRDEIGSVSSAYKVFKVNEYIVYSDLLERLMRLRVKYFYNAVSSSSREGQSISAEGLGLLKIVLPPRNVQVAFYTQNDSIAALIQDTKVESRILAAMHDTLLPKLISGGLRVQNANKFIGSDA
jgi:type I restriction enzyme S subunit